jgi:ABC-2 type transport system permease protein
MREALHAEWTKLCTVSSTVWLLLAAVTGTIGVSAAVLASTTQRAGQSLDTTKVALTGVEAGQAIIAVLAVLSISTEYSTGMASSTLTAMPRRLTVLAAKAATLVGLTVIGGLLAVGGCLLAGHAILPGRGYTAVHGYPALSLAHASTARAAVGSVLYLVLIALLSLGIATAVRDSATAIGTVLGLLYLFPLLAETVSDPTWHRHLEQAGPMTAGLAIQATTNLSSLPISPWSGLGVLTAWSAAALLAGGTVLHLRDT